MDDKSNTFTPTPFWQRFPEIFLYPFRGSGIFIILGVSFFIYFIGFLGCLGPLIGLGMSFSFLFTIIKAASIGREEIPEATDYLEFIDNIVMPLIRGVAALAWILIPLAFYLFHIKNYSEISWQDPEAFQSLLLDPFIFIFLLLGFFYLPIAMVLAAINENLGHVLNPIIGVNLIRQAFADYLVLIVVLFFLSLGDVLFLTALKHTIFQIEIPIVMGFIKTICRLYFPMIQAFVIGYWIYQNSETFDYNVPFSQAKVTAYAGIKPTQADFVPSGVDPLHSELSLVQTLIEEGSMDRAKEMLGDIASRFPADERPSQYLFQIALKGKDLPLLADYGNKIIHKYFELRKPEDALMIYQDILQLGEDAQKVQISSDLLYRVGQEFYRIGRFEFALKAYIQMGIIYPQDPKTVKALFQVGNVYLEKYNNPQKALQYYRQLLKENSQSPFAQTIQQAIDRAQRLMTQLTSQ